MNKNLKVAIVCDWLTGIGGAERVLLQLHKLFPDAPIYTSQYDKNKIDWFLEADVRTTWLQKLPSSLKKFLPVLRAIAFRGIDLSEYDLVISSSGAEAKAVKTGPKTIHICYCHSPTQYYWVRYDEYMKNPGFGAFDWLARIGLRVLINPMKRLDFKAAQKPDYLIANSTYTKENIKKYYGRESIVISPPVDIERFKSSQKIERSGFLITGRQTPYKKFDLVVKAFSQIEDKLTVVGNGPQHEKLEAMASSNVVFVKNPSDLEITKYYRQSRAFFLPNVDDFGIVAVEALASGMPVIAYKKGGPLDYIKEGENGLFFDKQTVGSLVGAINKFISIKFSEEKIVSSSLKFSPENFRENIKKYIESVHS